MLTHGHEDHVGALPFVLREIGDVARAADLRRAADGRDGALEARRAQAARTCRSTSVEPGRGRRARARSRSSWSRWPTRSPTRSPSRSSASSAPRSSPATTSSTRRRSTASPADVSRLAELGREGLLLLCGDSTNADRPGHGAVGVERRPAARGGLRALRRADRGHLLRLEHPPRPAGGRRGRRARPQGLARRALDAQEREHRPQLGHIDVPEGMLVGLGEIDDFPDHKLVVISTGSQGEPLSALRRMAHGDHPHVELHEGDTVIFSATPIPGNERAVNETIDRIYHLGADVITTRDAPIHASGPRLRRGAQADAQPDEAALRDAGPRRPQAAAAARPARRGGRDRRRRRSSAARTACRSRSTRAARASASASRRA